MCSLNKTARSVVFAFPVVSDCACCILFYFLSKHFHDCRRFERATLFTSFQNITPFGIAPFLLFVSNNEWLFITVKMSSFNTCLETYALVVARSTIADNFPFSKSGSLSVRSTVYLDGAAYLYLTKLRTKKYVVQWEIECRSLKCHCKNTIRITHLITKQISTEGILLNYLFPMIFCKSRFDINFCSE